MGWFCPGGLCLGVTNSVQRRGLCLGGHLSRDRVSVPGGLCRRGLHVHGEHLWSVGAGVSVQGGVSVLGGVSVQIGLCAEGSLSGESLSREGVYVQGSDCSRGQRPLHHVTIITDTCKNITFPQLRCGR